MFGNSNRDPTPSEINELTYLDMVVKETLRICPSVPIISRGITEDVEVGKLNYYFNINKDSSKEIG